MGRKLIDLTGQRFGRLTVISRIENVGHNTSWLCKCDCGNEKIVSGNNLRNGSTKSCGCIKNLGNTKHSLCNSRIYRIYTNIHQRCYCKYSTIYKHYGGRGITICDEWKNDFLSFYSWAINNGYADNLTIDRIDTNGNYEPDNCRWVTMKIQNYNRRSSLKFEHNGEVYNTKQLAEKTGLTESAIQHRHERGWTVSEIVDTPTHHARKK